jgi:poly-beta-1,6-N-acetyl-D-glucosamine synthase
MGSRRRSCRRSPSAAGCARWRERAAGAYVSPPIAFYPFVQFPCRPGERTLVAAMPAPPGKLLLVTPAFNEAKYLDVVVAAVCEQARRPDEWVIVDDGSTDETPRVLERAVNGHPWIRSIRLPVIEVGDTDRLEAGRPAKAFSAGVRAATVDWEYVGKLDADIELAPDYYAVLLGRMDADAKLGMTAGRLVEPVSQGAVRVVSVPSHHVPGAITVYRRSCFDEIGGVRGSLGWDSVDEILARMQGFTTRSYEDVAATHLRPTGAVSGVVRGRARHGRAAWIVHYPIYFVLLRSLKLAGLKPRPILGLAFLWGFASAGARGVPRVADAHFRSFVRRELRRRTFRRWRLT